MGWFGRVRASVVIGLCCFLIYALNGRAIGAGDTLPARYLPFAILKHHTLYLDPVADLAAMGRGDDAFWLLHRPDGHLVSLYPVVTPALITPLYAPAVAYLNLRGWTIPRVERVARVMEKLAASLLAALSVALLYELLRRRTNQRTALLLTVAYAFGTTTWVVSSQALWQHGLAQVLVVGAVLLLTGATTRTRLALAGLLLGLMAGNRPPDAVLAAVLGLYGLSRTPRHQWPWLVGASALPLLLVLAYNLQTVGHIAGGYGLKGSAVFLQHDLLVGLGGLLVSPTRGLLLFSPFLVALAWIPRYWPSRLDHQRLSAAMLVAISAQMVLYAKSDWRAGLSWGPRYLTDLLPFAIWLLVPIVEALRGTFARAFRAAVAVAVAIQALGAFCYISSLDVPIYAADTNSGGTPHDMRGAWRWRHSPVWTSLQRGWASPDLLLAVRGSVDRVEQGGRAVTAIHAGDDAALVGWTLVAGQAPWQVALSIDGETPLAAAEFTTRPDVRDIFRTSNAAGWRIPFQTSSLAPGPHQFSILVWSSDGGDTRLLDQRTLAVTTERGQAADTDSRTEALPADLRTARSVASSRLSARQQPDGYWLTMFTQGADYRDARPEMNTFLTSLMVDLLAPLVPDGRFVDVVQRARIHLSAQIEGDGLVRYHGRPDGPGIGTLGCVITPDTDDTALVWRTAPSPDRTRLDRALDTIARYRTASGLYRTWLAPRDAYQCLDPGHDPNPADLGIQMHLYMLLAGSRPPDARALCTALRAHVDSDAAWVYYRQAPLVPALRVDDLRRAGCDVALPDPRVHTAVPEQQVWVSLADMLADTARPPLDAVLVRALLRELARDNFAFVERHPPLFYHNDLSATVPRFYWSEDLGYALWLRLLEVSRSLETRH